MTTDIKKLRELLAAATPGPWRPEPNSAHGDMYHILADNQPPMRAGMSVAMTHTAHDMKLIVAAINALPELQAENERYERALNDLAKNECSHCFARRKAREALGKGQEK